MSIYTPHRRLFDDSAPDESRRAAARALVAPARMLAGLRRAALDRRLADGADSTHRRALTVRAWQITRPSARERLATALDAILVDAARPRPRRERGARVPICREEVEVARGEMLHLVERLRDPRPVYPRGVALTRRLLTDGAGPLYAPSANDELWRRVRRASAALD